MNFYNSEKLKSYLKSESNRLGINVKHTYDTFFSRLLLERIAKSSDSSFLVNGSFSQLIHLKKLVRPVTDVDLITKAGETKSVDLISAVLKNNSIDSLIFGISDSEIKISNTGILSMTVIISFDKLRHYISLDINVGNPIIYEQQFKKVPAVFSTDSEYFAYTTSFEEHLAEKLCIVVESNLFSKHNSRVKDLYDIYQMHGGEYDLDKFAYYFERMLEDRGKAKKADVSTEFLNGNYIKNHLQIWEEMSEKYEFLDKEIDLAGTVFYTRAVLSEQLQRIKYGENQNAGTQLKLISPK